MANLDTSSNRADAEKKVLAHPEGALEQSHKTTAHQNLLSDAYDFLQAHKSEAKTVVAGAAITGAALALRHYMPASVAEKISTSGASILEKTMGSAPRAVQELKVLDAPEKVQSLVSKLKSSETASDILHVRDPKSGAEFSLLAGHSPLAPEAVAKADRIATCDLPAGCESKGIFADQRGPVFLKVDRANQVLRLTEIPETLSQRVTRFLKGDHESWVPLGPHPSPGLRALQADQAAMRPLERFEPTTSKITASPKEIVDRWEAQQRAADLNSGTQGRVTKYIRSQLLPELHKSGAVSKDWRFIQTQMHSASDGAGADAIFVNQADGRAHLIDFSSLPAKRIRPAGEAMGVRRAGISDRPRSESNFDFSEDWQERARENSTESFAGHDKNIPGVRAQGLIGFDPKWFDSMGGLDTEIPEAKMFKQELIDHLSDLTSAPAYFNVGKTPFPSILTTDAGTQVKQLEALKQWSIKEAGQPDSLYPDGYREYAGAVDKTIRYLKANYTAVGDTKQFNTVVQQAADQTIFRWAVDKVGPPVANDAQQAGRTVTQPFAAAAQGDTNLRYIREKGVLDFKHDGLTYASEPLIGQNGILDRSRISLLQKGRVQELFDDMSIKQKAGLFQRLAAAGKAPSEENAIKEITRVLIERGNEIKAGGQLGVARPGSTPPLVERIHQRVNIHTVSTLTRPMDIPTTGPELTKPRLQ